MGAKCHSSGDVHEMQPTPNKARLMQVLPVAMKTSYFSSSVRAWFTAALAAVCVLAFTTDSYADRRHHRHHHRGHHHGRVIRGHHHNHHHHYSRNRFYAYPRSNFVITFGNGYAGRGYYYGPPGYPYYYQRPGVVYYRNRGYVPSRYW